MPSITVSDGPTRDNVGTCHPAEFNDKCECLGSFVDEGASFVSSLIGFVRLLRLKYLPYAYKLISRSI